MYVGGKLLRLISDNFFNMIQESMDQLGWFDAGRRHKPVVVIAEPVSEGDKVEPNLISITEEDISSDDIELGSQLAEHRYLYYIDVYAESKSMALSLVGDLKDILDGRFNSIGRDWAGFEVLDLSQATPTHLFYAGIENIAVDRARFYNKPFEKYWWVLSFDIVYSYNNETSDY